METNKNFLKKRIKKKRKENSFNNLPDSIITPIYTGLFPGL